MQRRVRLTGGLAAALIMITAAVLLAAAPAQAHASLVATDPAHGAQLAQPPAEIRLRFSERVTVASGGVVLHDADGAAVTDGGAAVSRHEPTEVRLPLPRDLPDGTYLVSWRVVSADSHPIAGAVVFSVGDQPPRDLTITDTGADPALSALFAVSRGAGYVGLALLAGGLLVTALCWPGGWARPRVRRLLVTGWVISAASAAAVLLWQGPYAAGRGLSAAWHPELLQVTMGSDFGRYVLARLLLLGLAGALVLGGMSDAARPVRRRVTRPVAVTLAVTFAVALSATWIGTGHTNTTGRPLDLAIDTAHLAAMASWFGGLALLVTCLLPRSCQLPPQEVSAVLPRFSRLATASVVTLLGTGAYIAWREVGSLSALTGTTYGRLLAFKLAAVGILLWLGALSRAVVQRRHSDAAVGASAPNAPGGTSRSARRAARSAAASQRAAGDQLRQSVRLEVATAVTVLAIASVLVATPPGAVDGGAAAAPPPPAAGPQQAALPGGGTVEVLVDPAWSGANQIVVTVRDDTGTPWEVPEVSASFSLAEEDLGPVPVELSRTAAGTFEATGALLPTAGRWQLRVAVRTSEVDSSTVMVDVPVW